MDINRIIKGIEDHKDGITLDWEGNVPTLKGYMVSVTNNVPSSPHKSDIRRAIQKLNTARVMLGMRDALLGSWMDSEGRFFIDLSLNVLDRAEALAVARVFKQQAVFNLDTFETITV